MRERKREWPWNVEGTCHHVTYLIYFERVVAWSSWECTIMTILTHTLNVSPSDCACLMSKVSRSLPPSFHLLFIVMALAMWISSLLYWVSASLYLLVAVRHITSVSHHSSWDRQQLFNSKYFLWGVRESERGKSPCARLRSCWVSLRMSATILRRKSSYCTKGPMLGKNILTDLFKCFTHCLCVSIPCRCAAMDEDEVIAAAAAAAAATSTGSQETLLHHANGKLSRKCTVMDASVTIREALHPFDVLPSVKIEFPRFSPPIIIINPIISVCDSDHRVHLCHILPLLPLRHPVRRWEVAQPLQAAAAAAHGHVFVVVVLGAEDQRNQGGGWGEGGWQGEKWRRRRRRKRRGILQQ